MTIAKIFMNGRSQAVRLPKEFRFASNEVTIWKEGDKVILAPVPPSWDWLDGLVGHLSEDFMQDGREQPAMPESDVFFE